MAGHDHGVDHRLNTVLQAARKHEKGKKGKLLQAFITEYFSQVPRQDLLALGASELMALAAGHLKVGETRKPKQTLVRAYTPDAKRDGWSCLHSVIEIVTDDMPFLVDSVSAELTRREIPIHLVIHPICKIQRTAAGKIAGILERGHVDVDARP